MSQDGYYMAWVVLKNDSIFLIKVKIYKILAGLYRQIVHNINDFCTPFLHIVFKNTLSGIAFSMKLRIRHFALWNTCPNFAAENSVIPSMGSLLPLQVSGIAML